MKDETIVSIPVDDIAVDYEWNGRSKSDVFSDTSSAVQDSTSAKKSAQGEGILGLMSSIYDVGQDTPVVVRLTEGKTITGKKTPKKYELLNGFRRFSAIETLQKPEHKELAKKAGRATVVPNTPDGTLRAVVRTVADATEARLVNARENTIRSNLSSPDQVRIAAELGKRGMNQAAICEALGMTQSWVSKLCRVGELPAVILDHWRDGKPIAGLPNDMVPLQLTVMQLVDLHEQAKTQNMPQGEIVKRYIDVVSPIGAASVATSNGDGQDRVAKRIAETAALMARLVLAGVLESGTLEWSRVIGPKKGGFVLHSGTATQTELARLWDIADEAYSSTLDKASEMPAAPSAEAQNAGA